MREWTIPDLIDFEFFLAQEEASTDAATPQRDRRIFLEEIEPHMAPQAPGGAAYRRSILRLWLDSRAKLWRQQNLKAVPPGQIFAEAKALLRLAVAIIGLIMGATLALSLLTYTGKAAVNVSLYLGVLVFLQLLTLIIMVRFLFFKTSLGTLREHSLLYVSLSRALERIATRISRSSMARVEGNKRDELQAISGLMQGMYGIYGKVLFWPFFSVVQLFGVMFNVGAIGATLTRVMTSDLAFGWQSTVQMSAAAVYTLVRTMALPWSWLFGPYAYPSLAQIEGSRMVLKEGLTTLATGNLVAWWPFLVGAVGCYGLLPRVLLSIAAHMGEKRALTRLRFSHAACDHLILRMTSPTISTGGVPEITRPSGRSQAVPETPEVVYLSLTDAAVLIPEDIPGSSRQEELDGYLAKRLGWKLTQLLPISGNIAQDRPLIAKAARRPDGDERAVVLVQEAWQPPIAETIGLIREIRAAGGKDMPIAVLLIGKPGAGELLTPVRPLDKTIWHKALTKLADPYLSVVTAGDV